jgi:transcriptional regulator with PAS, ATPase and Fis domain
MRAISLYESHALDQFGLRLFDEVEILPTQGRKKTISLNRTKFKFLCEGSENLVHEGVRIILPKLRRKSTEYHLDFCRKAESTDKGCFLLKSMDNAPFRLNGNYVHEAYINRGDEVLIGYNRLKFLEKTVESIHDIESRDEKLLSQKFIKSNLNILIEGETGTGKSRLAKKIHNKSGRRGRFVHINLSSFSAGLIESELFGHIKGAFTGACSEKEGAIIEAHGGTLFIDEIDSLPLDIQTKLLLFLDNKSIRPVGGQFNRTADVRLVFATGSSLTKKVSLNEMRKDFYFRLISGTKIKLPSLREDKPLIRDFCEYFASINDAMISSKLIKFYSKLDWPGNIRQLSGHLEKKLVLANGKKLEFDESDAELKYGFTSLPYDEVSSSGVYSMEDFKNRYCAKVYFQTGENVKRSSRILGLTPNTIRAILKKTI